MLIWGSRGDVVQLGSAGTAHCGVCEKEREFKNVLSYRYAHIWYLFNWVTEKTYATVCDVCGRGNRHDAKAFESKLGKSPIPAFRRFGGLALGALVVLVVVFGFFAAKQSDAEEARLLGSPTAGDLYTVDLGKLAPGGFDERAYGVMRVVKVDGQTVALQVPNVGYSKIKGAFRDLSGDALKDSYYSEEVLEYPLAELKQLHDSGAINSIDRK